MSHKVIYAHATGHNTQRPKHKIPKSKRRCSFVSPLFGCLGIAFKFAEMDHVAKVHDLAEASKSISTTNPDCSPITMFGTDTDFSFIRIILGTQRMLFFFTNQPRLHTNHRVWHRHGFCLHSNHIRLVDRDMEAGTVRKAGPHARNLLRVKSRIDMVKVLFEQIIVTKYVPLLQLVYKV
ncbi:accelerated cell death 11-like [Rosa chinensis]|uniref:accelerated cell death 11-like n=1 Tax=Rosa chinensis TaxID=74649 RepID=UPI001AD8DF5A|nr:accelerated cell death 11-like [Rosa chinensis]